MWALALACAGSDGGSTSPTITDPEVCPGGGADAEEISEAALPTCNAVAERYSRVLGSFSGCTTDEDCHVLTGQCEVSLGACYEVANTCLAQAVLDELGALHEAHSRDCVDAVCRCAEAPEAACREGLCLFADTR